MIDKCTGRVKFSLNSTHLCCPQNRMSQPYCNKNVLKTNLDLTIDHFISFLFRVALFVYRYIAMITKQKSFNKSLVDEDTQIIFMDECYDKLLDPDDWKVSSPSLTGVVLFASRCDVFLNE